MTTPAAKITVPSSLLDASLHHQVYLGRYSTSVVHDIVGLLNDMDKDLISLIKQKGEVKNFTTERLNALLVETEKITKEAAQTAAETTSEKLQSFAAHEAGWNADVLKSLTGAQLDIVTPTAEHLATIVSDKPFQGALLGEWFGKLAVDKQHAITQAARLGFSEGETIDQIVRRLTGTKAAGYADGALEITRRHAEAVVRTAVNHTSNASQQLTFKQNEDLIQGWVFVATLDGRTTVTCASLSGTKWPVGEGPIPPRHFRCRSFSMPLLKTWKEMGINIDEIPAGTRAAIGGPVNADISFSEWLKTQNTKVQDDMLGKTRAELFRKGGLTVDKFTDSMGNVLTLDELKAKEAAAFKNVFGSKEPTGSGGGHLGKAAPVSGPMDFSHIMDQQLSPAAVAEVEKAKAAQAAAEAKVQAKKEYMAKYNAAKNAAKAATKAAAEAEAKAMAEAKAAAEAAKAAEEAVKLQEAKVAFKESYLKGEMLSDDALKMIQTLTAEEKSLLLNEAKAMKAAAEAEAKKIIEAKAAFEKAALEQEHLGQGLLQINADHQAIIGNMTQPDYLDLMGKIQTKIKAQQAEKAAVQAVAEDQAKKWQMYKPKIKAQMMEGKPLSPAFQNALDNAPMAEKAKLLGAVEEAKLSKATIKAAEEAALKAQAEAQAAAAAQAKAEAEAIAAQAAKAKAEADALAMANKPMTPEQQKKWDMYKPKIKKQLLDGKDLSPAFQAALDSVPAIEKDKFMAQITKQAVAQPAKPVTGLFVEEKYTKAIIEMGGNNMEFWMPYLDVAGQGEAAILAKAKQLGMSEASGSWEKLKAAIEAAKGNTKALYDLADKYGPGSAIGQGAVKAINVLKTETLAAPEIKAKIADVAEHKLDFKNMEKLEGKKGSNEGGLFLDKSTGQKWYIKTPESMDQAINEVTANALYRLGGINVPETLYIEVNGQFGIASKWVDGIVKGSPAELAKAGGAMEGFAMDAWLCNWDVVGLSYDNLLIQGGRAIRIDNGGALIYKAMGTSKGNLFSNVVTELQTMRNASDNAKAASVFSKITQGELEAGVRKVLAITDREIIDTIDQYAAKWTAQERKDLANKLIARRDSIKSQFPHLQVEKPIALPADAGARVTDAEMRLIKDSRINGYVMPTDKDMIEDHHVLVWQEKDVNGKMVTKARFKVIGNTYEELMKETRAPNVSTLESAIKGVTVDQNSQFSDSVITAIRGIAKQASMNAELRAVDIERAHTAIENWNKLKRGIVDKTSSEFKQMEKHYDPWIKKLEHIAGQSEGSKSFDWDTSVLYNKFNLPTIAPQKVVSSWTEQEYRMAAKKTVKGWAQDTGKVIPKHSKVSAEQWAEMKRVQAKTVDDVKVNFWGDNTPFAVKGTIEMSVAGDSAEVTQKLFAAIEKMGIDASRSTVLDREELYLRQIVYHRNEKLANFSNTVDGIADQQQRIKAAQAWINKEVGFDITKVPDYQPEGVYQAFGQGRVNTFRPDLAGPKWDEFAKDYSIYHAHTSDGTLAEIIDIILENGGQMAPSVDKLRRGFNVGGMSPGADLRTGGANYFFTRIYPESSKHSGFYWNPTSLKRLDAISYPGDKYGETTPGFVPRYRMGNIDKWSEAYANSSSNETNFKNSLSMFDNLRKIEAGSASARDEIIKIFKKHGHTKINGIPIETIVRG